MEEQIASRLEDLTRQSRHVLVTVIAVFFFTSLILIIAGAPPLAAYYHIIKGSLGSWLKFAHVIKAWIPLTLCACGLVFTFRIGLWNIGIEGQVMMGAIFSTAALRFGLESQMPAMIISSSIVAGLIGGALWALFAGFLKTKGDVNEIFAGLGLNFVAQGMILWLIFGPWKRPGGVSTAFMVIPAGVDPFVAAGSGHRMCFLDFNGFNFALHQDRFEFKSHRKQSICCLFVWT
jgi:simple sugar transport system permease protein